MARAEDTEVIDKFEGFYRDYYRNEIGQLAQKYPNEKRSLYVEWDDLYRFDPDLADDFIAQPEQMRDYAEEALRLYDLPVDVKLGQAHVRVRGLQTTTGIREIRSRHRGQLVEVTGIIRKATDVRPKITEAAFECQRCGTLTRIPQTSGEFHEPHECQGCERQGPFDINFDQSEFVDAQKLRVQESPEGLRGGETPQSIDVHIDDDITGEVTAGDHVRVTGMLHLDQQGSNQEKSPVFDVYMDGMSVEIEDEQFEDMDITDEDKKRIIELSNESNIYEKMIASMAPSIYGYEQEKLAIIMQLFSGVTKHLPDGSRTRGDLHVLLIGDPGTGKCVKKSTMITLSDGNKKQIGDIVESNLDDPNEIEDGYYDEAEIELPTMHPDGSIRPGRATKVWKREAPDRMYRIETSLGNSLEVTPSHPLFIPSDGTVRAARAEDLTEGMFVATTRGVPIAPDGGETMDTLDVVQQRPDRIISPTDGHRHTGSANGDIAWDRIESIEVVVPDHEWVYDLEVEGTHSYISNNIISHNSQLLQYVRNLAPRSVYTSGKGSSSAGLTAAAVRDDFGDGQQWTLEAGALVLADQGIAAVDELDKMRCVTGDSLVHLSDGRLSRINELAREAEQEGSIEELPNGRTIRGVDLTVWTMSDDGRLVERPVTAIHEYEAPDELTEVTLDSGERITATHDHPFFVFEDGTHQERSAAELEPGDWTCVPKQLSEPTTDGGLASSNGGDSIPSDAIEPSFGAVLGYLSGDGNIYYNREEGSYGIRFTNKEEELLEDFERTCEDAFGKAPVRHPSEQRDDGVGTVRLHGREYADRVLEAGMNIETYDDKSFPTRVTTGTRRTKAAFIRAFADSEGNVDSSTANVRMYSASEELLLGMKSLLLEFGVSCQIRTRERSEKRDLYVLTITSAESIRSYNRYVGFTLERKQDALDEVCASVEGDRTIVDVLPDCDDLFKEIRTSLRLHHSECGIDGTTYCNFENGDANCSLHRASTIVEAFERRIETANRDAEVLADDCSWDSLQRFKDRYHISQRELADGTSLSQQQISGGWKDSENVRETVQTGLRELVENVSNTELSPLADLINGDVKWRRVKSVDTAIYGREDDRIPILRQELADLLDCSAAEAKHRALELLDRNYNIESWTALRDEVDRYGVPLGVLGSDIGVAGSTISRWSNNVVETDRFEEVRTAAENRISEKCSRIRKLLNEIESREETNVYDLTVEGTHNFVANGMVVHNSEDRSAMHEALEQQSISISKAGINATLKSRCSLLGAANPKYGRFDQYESIGEQIDLEPALISRFDLIFTVTDQPDAEEDANLADHILNTNYAGELHTHRENTTTSNVSEEEVQNVTDEVEPEIDPELLRKYIAHAKRNCYPMMSEEAKAAIRDFYVDLRAKGQDEDSPVPVTARKLEALVRLSEASARMRLSDTVEQSDAERVIEIVRTCLQNIGVDPETGEFDADVVETGQSKTQRDRIKNIKAVISEIESEYDEGAPIETVLDRAEEVGMERSQAEHEIEKLRRQGDVYEPTTDHLRTV